MSIKRQDIINAIQTRMQGILTSSGYNTNLGSSVILNRPQTVGADGAISSPPVDPSELPCVLIRDPLDEITPVTLTRHLHRLTVEVEIRAEEGATTAVEMRKMARDVYAAIGTDAKWSGLAIGTTPVSDETVILQGDKIIGATLLKVIINFETDPWSES